MAHALHNLVQVQSKPSIDGDELKAALLGVSFTGVTGQVAFNPGTGSRKLGEGDRSAKGTKYTVMNFDKESGKAFDTGTVGVEAIDGTNKRVFKPCIKGSPNCGGVVYNAV